MLIHQKLYIQNIASKRLKEIISKTNKLFFLLRIVEEAATGLASKFAFCYQSVQRLAWSEIHNTFVFHHFCVCVPDGVQADPVGKRK